MKKILLTICTATLFLSSSSYAVDSNVFAKVHVGHSKIRERHDLKTKDDMFFGVGVGSYIMNNVRVDVTLEHFNDPSFHKNNQKISGDVNTLLLNGMIDVADISLIKIFVGAGIGFGQVQTSFTDNSSSIATKITKSEYDTAYAVYLGGSVEFAPGIFAELTYSYRAMGESKNVNNSKLKFKGNNLSAGVRLEL